MTIGTGHGNKNITQISLLPFNLSREIVHFGRSVNTNEASYHPQNPREMNTTLYEIDPPRFVLVSCKKKIIG